MRFGGSRDVFPELWQEIINRISTGNSYRGKRVARGRMMGSPSSGWRRLQSETARALMRGLEAGAPVIGGRVLTLSDQKDGLGAGRPDQ